MLGLLQTRCDALAFADIYNTVQQAIRETRAERKRARTRDPERKERQREGKKRRNKREAEKRRRLKVFDIKVPDALAGTQ